MSYSSEVLADSPIAYWKLDDPLAADSSGNGNTFLYGAGVTVGGTALLSDGGMSVHGDGSHAIATRQAVATGLTGGNVTLEAWVTIPAGNVNGPIINVGSETTNGWAMGVGGTTFDNTGKQLIFVTNAIAWNVSGYNFSTGTHHVMAARGSGNTVRCYVDGSLVATVTLSTPNTATSTMHVGGSQSRALSSTVQVDNVALYAADLTSAGTTTARVTAHYNSGSGDNAAVAADTPAVWLKLDEPSASPVSTDDSSGNGHSITHAVAPTLAQGSLLGDGSGTSVSYNGSTQYSTAAGAAWMATPSGLTVEARIRPAAGVLSAGGFIASQWAGGTPNIWLFGVTSAGKLTAQAVTGGTVRTATGATTLTAGTDYTVALRWTSGGNLEVFLNGVSDGSTAASGSLASSSTQALDIGRAANSGGAGLTWNGRIDELSITGSSLSSGRMTARHAAAIANGVTGAVAATAPSPTVAVAGLVTRTGQVAATPASPTLAVAGNVAGVTSGAVAATAPSPTLSVAGNVTAPISGAVAATPAAPSLSVTDSTNGAAIQVGVKIEVGALTLLTIVALPGTEVRVGLGAITVGDSQPVVPLPGVNIGIGSTLISQTAETIAVDPRRSGSQWRYVVTDLANTPLGELVDITHDPVADGVNTPTTMKFVMAADDPARALIETDDPMTRKCQVWDGNRLLLWGPLLPDQQSDTTVAGYTVHDPSWWWRGGRRVIGRFPRLNLLHNGDFKSGLTYWTRGYDADSIPKAAPAVRVVSEDFLEDTDGLDPIRAAEITGVESVTESELSSNAVFWPNLATFRPGGVAAIEAVANAMPTTAGLKVTVIGHTANDGTGNGLGLSLRRAIAAKAVILTKRPSAVITTKGVGYYDPKPGFPIDSQAQRRVVIQYDQTITGKSKQWIKQTISVSQPKTARYPLVLTLAAMLKVADDWSVPDANMTSLKVVVRRQGAAKPVPWDAQLGIGESSISDTDPVDRWIDQTAQATVPADGRTYLVDVYLYAPAALARYTAVGLFPEEQLYFWGVDQALIFKGIVEHIQSTALGHGDLGIETRTPLTGILRDRTYPFRNTVQAEEALEEFGALNRGMDYDTQMYADGRIVLATYYPQQGKRVDYTFVLGGNVANATPERTRDIASSIIMQAQDIGSYRAEAYAKDTRALGGLLLEKVVTAEQGTPLNELREAARQELAWGSTSTIGYWLDIDPDSIAEVLANTNKGDVVRLILDTPVALDRIGRIMNRERHPDSLRLFVALEA